MTNGNTQGSNLNAQHSDCIAGFLAFKKELFEEAEGTEEFKAFAKALGARPLASDLERLAKREERQRKKSKSKHKVKSLDEWKQDTARHAAKGFFRNTGTCRKLGT